MFQGKKKSSNRHQPTKANDTYNALSLFADGGTATWTSSLLLLGVVSVDVPGSAVVLPMAWAPRLLMTNTYR